MDDPYLGCGWNELAHACDERAMELHARAWHSEAERTVLREATADLLSAVARRLSEASSPRPGSGHGDAAVEGVPAEGMPGEGIAVEELGIAALREIIATHVTYVPLSGAARHAWVQAFVPGDGDAPARH